MNRLRALLPLFPGREKRKMRESMVCREMVDKFTTIGPMLDKF